jgi:hypothetical protein
MRLLRQQNEGMGAVFSLSSLRGLGSQLRAFHPLQSMPTADQ